MDLLAPHPSLNLDNPELRLRTAGAILPPARFGPKASVSNSLISPGAQIEGTVERSVISPGVVIEEGAVVRDSIVQHRTWVRSGAVVDRCIIDKEVTIGSGAVVGEGDKSVVNFDRPDIVNTGITIVGKRVIVPANLRIGRNVVLGPGVEQELAEIGHLESGASVHPTHMPLHLFV